MSAYSQHAERARAASWFSSQDPHTSQLCSSFPRVYAAGRRPPACHLPHHWLVTGAHCVRRVCRDTGPRPPRGAPLAVASGRWQSGVYVGPYLVSNLLYTATRPLPPRCLTLTAAVRLRADVWGCGTVPHSRKSPSSSWAFCWPIYSSIYDLDMAESRRPFHLKAVVVAT